MTNNIFVKNEYEIHFSNNYIIVKDIRNKHYLRLTGKSRKYIEENINSDKLTSFLHTIFSSRTYSAKNKLICIEYTNSQKFKNVITMMPSIFFRLSFMISIITLGIISGLVSMFFEKEHATQPFHVYLCWTLLNIIVHEMGHIILCIKSGRSVYSFGLKLNYFIPMAYIDTSDICMSNLKYKVATSLGGIYLNAILCIIATVTYLINDCPIFSYLATISLFFVFSNLVPFFKLDGYYVVSDLFEETSLNRASKSAIKKLLLRENKLSNHDFVLILFYILKNIFFIAVLGSIFYECFLFIASHNL